MGKRLMSSSTQKAGSRQRYRPLRLRLTLHAAWSQCSPPFDSSISRFPREKAKYRKPVLTTGLLLDLVPPADICTRHFRIQSMGGGTQSFTGT